MEIEFPRGSHSLLEFECFGDLARLRQLRNGIGGSLFRLTTERRTIAAPRIGPNFWRRPRDGFGVACASRQCQCLQERFGAMRFKVSSLPVQFDRPLVPLKLREIRGQDHHRRGIECDHVLTRQEYPFDLRLRPPGRFHGEREDLVHPRLHPGLNNGLFEAGDHFLVLPVSDQIVHGLADGFRRIRIRGEPFAPSLGPFSGSFAALLRPHFGAYTPGCVTLVATTQNKRSGGNRNRLPPLRLQFNDALVRLEPLHEPAGDYKTRFFFIASIARLSNFGPC